ncbi:Fis family transcriptional regulator [Saccharomonospora piscinae]|uniref:Fis family transcriptional regulator n=1 Tax=Saccharomonospora piscinae TaxID=687388 RepID=A0A1V8ZZR6_SACPI|nr:zf-HC2 domain-containing protein [Saccharomonospora piscinae]OQO90243.1 Fis family transcriptional regulator [Saccharomonospora piscinae]
MTVGKGWGLAESHLLPDAVVAFVDQELSIGAQERAAAHLAHCPRCAAEVAAQRAASSAVRQARTPTISTGFLASLCDIPQNADLPGSPDNLAVGADGQVMAVQRPDRVAGLRDTLPPGALGTSAPLGTSPSVLGGGTRHAWSRRRATQGAGVVVSGLVLSALALVANTGTEGGGTAGADPDASTTPRTGVLPARFGGQAQATQATSTSSTPATPTSSGATESDTSRSGTSSSVTTAAVTATTSVPR